MTLPGTLSEALGDVVGDHDSQLGHATKDTWKAGHATGRGTPSVGFQLAGRMRMSAPSSLGWLPAGVGGGVHSSEFGDGDSGVEGGGFEFGVASISAT